MTPRRFIARVLVACVLISAAAFMAVAEPLRPLRIGYIVNGPERSVFEEQFEFGLRDNGYVPGRNITIDYRHHLRPDQDLGEVMTGFVQAKVDAILVSTRTAALAAKAATTQIPIIFSATRDAVQDGLVTSLARPEANLTGQSFHAGELSAKRIQLMREAFPQARKFGVLWNVFYPSPLQIEEAKRAEAMLGVELVMRGVEVPAGLDEAFSQLKHDGAAAIFVVSDVTTITNRVKIGEAAQRHQMPLMMSNKRYLTGSNLMSYGPDISEGFRRAARQLVRAANGTPVAELPVEQPIRFEFVVDLRAARMLGLEVPVSVLSRADEVFE